MFLKENNKYLTKKQNMLSNFATEFVTELFLDDNVSTMNRLIVATANVVNENFENVTCVNDILLKEYNQISPLASGRFVNSLREGRHFYEKIVKKFSDDEYIENFKMRKATVQALIMFLKEYVKPSSSIVPFDKKVHVFLWLLTSNYSFKEAGEKFGLHKSSISYIFHEIANLLSEQRYQFINWPSLEEQHVTRVKVNSRYGFPNCVGFIDACRLKVGSKRKMKDKPEFILLQAVCDETLMFTDIHVGEIGNTRKGKVFKESQLALELKNFLDLDNHILGDSDYKLRRNLLTPFTSDELLTSEEMKFNEIHWKAHSYINQAFEILRGKFMKLNHIDISKPESITTLIYAACVLHNFILLHEGSPVKEEAVSNDEGITIDTNVVTTALEKRQFLCNYINYIQNLQY
ncbi:protein ANTAGONIST OF LIKE HETEROCHROMATIN PROTEIN 1-like [Vanessa atalanta]|uniref:protein ANTAGONIST OF LIKE HETEROCHROMATIN PROTEIN 1-like n=1 Tax=Vanessa atalanta TaxID=42275 RepID=UPI001FCD30CD|nr:protein ANTAGONIST OF LIKE HETEROCHROMATIN PROTEIN 1-like [Vanessa atalanta]